MYCRNCGKQLNESMKFCPMCGTPIIDKNTYNLKQSFSNETQNERYPKKKKKSCLVTILKWCGIGFFILIALVFFTDTSDNSSSTEVSSDENNLQDSPSTVDDIEISQSDDETQEIQNHEITLEDMYSLPIYSYDYLISYIDYYEIDIHKEFERNTIKKALSMEKDAISLKATGNEKIKYAATVETSEYLYVGEMKDNKPHGVGKLMKIVSAKEYDSEFGTVMEFDEYTNAQDESQLYSVLIYIGEFKDGYYDGYGWEFISPFTNIDDLLNSPYKRNLGDDYVKISDNIEENILTTCSPIQYIGEFKKGMYDGDGILLHYAIREIPFGTDIDELIELFGYRVDREISFDIGEFKKGQINGETKLYRKGCLYYKGIMENGDFDEKGTLYYLGSKQKQYDGEWAHGVYHGKGTLFSEEGTIIYKGEWDMGDYAN